MYSLSALDVVTPTRTKNYFSVNLDTCHDRLSHANKKGIEHMVLRGVVRDVQITEIKCSLIWKELFAVKSHRVPFP